MGWRKIKLYYYIKLTAKTPRMAPRCDAVRGVMYMVYHAYLYNSFFISIKVS